METVSCKILNNAYYVSINTKPGNSFSSRGQGAREGTFHRIKEKADVESDKHLFLIEPY